MDYTKSQTTLEFVQIISWDDKTFFWLINASDKGNRVIGDWQRKVDEMCGDEI